jgi:hypothetical protein
MAMSPAMSDVGPLMNPSGMCIASIATSNPPHCSKLNCERIAIQAVADRSHQIPAAGRRFPAIWAGSVPATETIPAQMPE